MKFTRALIIFSLFAALLAACGWIGPKSELDSNREKWTNQNVSHYRYDLQIGCFCAFRDKMPLTIEIKDGQIVSVTDATGAAPSDQEMEWYKEYIGIDKIFDYAQKATQEADKTEITYDPETGIPTQVSVDWMEQAADDEMGLTISNFEKLP